MPNPDLPVPFGYKMSWLALHTTDQQSIVETLGLTAPRLATWQEGLDTVYEHPKSSEYVFITPPIDGWTLVVGDWTSGLDTNEMQELSALFGEAQWFLTHRVVEGHYWTLARNGKLLRNFAFVGSEGEFMANEGEQTAIERELGISTAWPEDWENAGDFHSPNESDVMAVAGAWSIDPSSLDEHTPAPGPGVLAEIPLADRPKRANA